MTSAGSDNWFGNALSGSDGTADPVVKHRAHQVWSDPTAAPPATPALAPIVLPPLHLQANRAQIEALVDLDDQPAPRRPPPPRPPAHRPSLPRPTPAPPSVAPGVRPTRPPHIVHAPPPAAIPPVQQWAPPPANHQGALGSSPWAGTQLPASVTNFLAGVQQHLPQQQQQGLHQLTQHLHQQQAPRPPQPVRKGSSVAGCFTVLFVIGLVLLLSGAGEQLFDLLDDLFNQ